MEKVSHVVSCMYGTVNQFNLELLEKKSGVEKYNIIDTYTYDSKKTGILLTDEQYYEKLKSFIGDRKIKGVHMKNNAASFVECIRRHGEHSVSEFVEVAQDTLVTIGWVSINDRLPEYDSYILVVNGGLVMEGCYNENDGDDYFSSAGDCRTLKKVTHWTPLPKPPQSEVQ